MFRSSFWCKLLIILAASSALGAPLWSQTERTLYSFTGGADGDDPLSTLVMDAAGNLYGTTFVGGAYGEGEVFELSPAAEGWK